MQVVGISPALAQWLDQALPKQQGRVGRTKMPVLLLRETAVSTIATLDPTCQVVDRTVDVQDEHESEISQSIIVAPSSCVSGEAPSCGT